MENEFIPYMEALALKELGFDEPCIGVYYGDEDDIQFVLNVRETQYYAQKGYKNGILVPTWQSAFRWFREKYGLCHFINFSGDGFCSGWEDKGFNEHAFENFKTYEEAELACITKLIEIVEQK